MLEPQHQLILWRWSNLLKLSNKHGKMVTWADPDLLLMLGFDHPLRVFPSPSLQLLLRQPAQPELTFFGFPHLAVPGTSKLPPPLGTSKLPPSTTAPFAPAPPSGSLPSPLKKKSRQWGHHKKTTMTTPHPEQQPVLSTPDKSLPPSTSPAASSHQHLATNDLPILDVDTLSQISDLPPTNRCWRFTPY